MTCNGRGWRKSGYSIPDGNCVEAASGDGDVAVRDTADRDGVTLVVPAAAFGRFAASVQAAPCGP